MGAEVFLKCENFQRGGAFKFRGAYHAAARLPRDQRADGLMTYSSGNHAQAVALTARELATTAVILMLEDAPRSKRAATAGYDAEIITYDRYTDDRAALATRRGLPLILPYDHPHVIAGQGTTALELLTDTGPLDMLVVPVGGGGLIAGDAITATGLHPGIRVVGVEPSAGDDTQRSLAAGHRATIDVPRTTADGQAATTPGELTFTINQRLVDTITKVTDDEIRHAMHFAFDRLKIVVEPSGATGLAALLTGRVTHLPRRVGAVISGGNVDPEHVTEPRGR